MTATTMTRSQALPYVSYVVDDAGAARGIDDDPHAIVRPGNPIKRLDDNGPHCYASVLIGWQCGSEPLFVAVHSYLDVRLDDDDEAIEMATDFLAEIKWFADGPREPDYFIR